MNLHIAGVMSAALVAGLAGSVAAYRAQVAEDPVVDQPAVESRVSQPVEPRARVRWAPCPKGSQLEEGVCVTDVVRTVVVAAAPAPAAAAVPAPALAPAAAANDPEDDDDEGYDDGDDRDEDDDHADEDEGEGEDEDEDEDDD